MARRSGLGKGLGSLIPTTPADAAAPVDPGTFRELPIASITPNRHQPRAHFDEESLVTLTASVREVGVIQPVLVRPSGDGSYELIAGERRWRAAKRAGLATIPALVRDADELATRVGRSRVAITNTLRLFQLPPSIQRLVGEGRISAGHARALLGTPDRAFQEALAKRIVDEGLSVRAVEEAVRARQGAPERGPNDPKPRLRPPGLLELEELLSERLDTRVKVDMGARRGKVVIEFASLEDLERIYRLMTTAPKVDGDVTDPRSPDEA